MTAVPAEPEPAAPSGDELDALVDRIDEATAGAVTALDAQESLGVGPEDANTPLAAVATGLLYIEQPGRRRPATGEFFGPIGQIGDWKNPPDIPDLEPWVIDTWEACADRVTSPAVRSRLHDLLFEARRGNGRDHAREAARAYMEMAERFPGDTDVEMTRIQVGLAATHALSRALDLARKTRQDDLATEVLRALVAAAERALDTAPEDAGPGVVLGFIEPLAHDSEQVPELDDLLARARARYEGDMWNTRSVAEISLSRPGVTPHEQARLHRAEIEAILAEAETAAGMLKVIHLQEAAQLAERYDLADLRQEAIRRLQATSGEDLGMVRVEHPVSLPKEAIDSTIEQIVGTTTWQDAFARLVGGEPPTGRLERNQASAAEAAQAAPFSHTIPVTRMGRDGLPRWTARTQAERDAYHLAETELRFLQILGWVFPAALVEIGQRFGPINVDELAEFLGTNNHVPPALAASLARSFGRFFQGDAEGAGFSAIPKVERLARELLLRMGAPIYNTARNGRPGQYSGLAILLSMLEQRGLDPSWHRFLTVLLTRPDGLNYRNEVCHGEVDEIDQLQAGIVLIAALYLALAVQAT